VSTNGDSPPPALLEVRGEAYISKPDFEKASSFAYISAMVFTPRDCAFLKVTGTTSDSGSEVRKM
jgi:NAD-dependent DNA ligase